MDACEATVPGTEINMGVFSETRGLDPIITSGSGVTGMTELSSLYDQLIVYDHDLATTGLIWRSHCRQTTTSTSGP